MARTTKELWLTPETQDNPDGSKVKNAEGKDVPAQVPWDLPDGLERKQIRLQVRKVDAADLKDKSEEEKRALRDAASETISVLVPVSKAGLFSYGKLIEDDGSFEYVINSVQGRILSAVSQALTKEKNALALADSGRFLFDGGRGPGWISHEEAEAEEITKLVMSPEYRKAKSAEKVAMMEAISEKYAALIG